MGLDAADGAATDQRVHQLGGLLEERHLASHGLDDPLRTEDLDEPRADAACHVEPFRLVVEVGDRLLGLGERDPAFALASQLEHLAEDDAVPAHVALGLRSAEVIQPDVDLGVRDLAGLKRARFAGPHVPGEHLELRVAQQRQRQRVAEGQRSLGVGRRGPVEGLLGRIDRGLEHGGFLRQRPLRAGWVGLGLGPRTGRAAGQQSQHGARDQGSCCGHEASSPRVHPERRTPGADARL